MSYFTVAELFKAYRKAKSDVFEDKQSYALLEFVKYEKTLEQRLRALAGRLSEPVHSWSCDKKFIGSTGFLPKSVESPAPEDSRVTRYSTLDPIQDWESQSLLLGEEVSAEFRQVMRPTVDFQIVSALWLMKVGEKYDRALDKKLSFAHNLRRTGKHGPIASDAHRLFEKYIYGYKAWRSQGVNAMRGALKNGTSIVAVTMDVKRFYHNVSPNFLLRKQFLSGNHIELTADDFHFTTGLINAINFWYATTPDANERPEGALPVGLSASRVISNVLLAQFDRHMSRQLDAIYYGRYADDVFLVVEKPEQVRSGEDLIKYLRTRLEGWLVLQREEDLSGLRLVLPYAKDSKIVFSSKKQKIFFLSGEHGLDLLDQIVDKIEEQSSQFQKLPELPPSESKMVARALLATPDARLEADSLRKAEAVSIRRFGFSMLLSDVEAYARDLDPNDWSAIRKKFYGLVLRYVVTPVGFFDYMSYTVRVFGLMIASRDYVDANALLDQFARVVGVLENTSSAGEADKLEFDEAVAHYRRGFFQAAMQATTVSGFRVSTPLLKTLRRVSRSRVLSARASVAAISKAMLRADLGRRAYFEYWFDERKTERGQPSLPEDFAVRKVVALTKRFRSKIHGIPAPYWPAVAFPTRPIPLSTLCITAPALMSQSGALEEVIQATRGSQVNPRYRGHQFICAEADGSHRIDVPWRTEPTARFGLSSYLARDDDWLAALEHKPNLKIGRYARLHKLINHMLAHDKKLDYVALPESCIPLKWALSIAFKLGTRGISFICGVESRGPAGSYTNEALVALASNFYGSRGSICFLQPKMELAHREAESCKALTFIRPGPIIGRPVFRHSNFSFGVLICSDLTTISNRAHFQGKIDALFVLEWNPDTSTFEFLVESASHDLHAAVVQVNNRQYGDSRIRMPYKESYRRDVVQVRGGESDFFVTASIDFDDLRKFQALGEGSAFKPTPIGYEMSEFRRSLVRNGSSE